MLFRDLRRQALQQKLSFASSCLLQQVFVTQLSYLSQPILAPILFSTFNYPLHLNFIGVRQKSERIHSFFVLFFLWKEVVIKPYVFITRNDCQVGHFAH